MLDALTPIGIDARAYVQKQSEFAIVKFYSRSGVFKVLPYVGALDKNCLGEGFSKDAAWLNARENMRRQEASHG